MYYIAISGVTNKLLQIFAPALAGCKFFLLTIANRDLLSTGAATCQR